MQFVPAENSGISTELLTKMVVFTTWSLCRKQEVDAEIGIFLMLKSAKETKIGL